MKNSPRERPNYRRRAGIAAVGVASLAALFAVCKEGTEKVLATSNEAPTADIPTPHAARESVHVRPRVVRTSRETPDEVDPDEAYKTRWNRLFPIGKEPTTVDEACRNFLQTGVTDPNIRQKSMMLGLLKLQLLTPAEKRATSSAFELFDQCDTDADQFLEVLKIGLKDENPEVVRFVKHAIQEECRTRLDGEHDALLNAELRATQAEGDDECYTMDTTTSYDTCRAASHEAYNDCGVLIENFAAYTACMSAVPNCIDADIVDSPRHKCYDKAAAQLETSFMQRCMTDVAQEHGFDIQALD